MRHINIKLSLNDVTSKLPGVVPFLTDTWEIPSLYTFCDNKKGRKFYSYSEAIVAAHDNNISVGELEHNTEFIDIFTSSATSATTVNGNYGLISSDVIIPSDISTGLTDYTDFYVNIPNGNDGFYDLSWPERSTDPHYEGRNIVSGSSKQKIKILTSNTLNKWYLFFKDYYKLIYNPEHERTYSDAVDYYEKTESNKNDTKRKKYEDLDKLFKARGGDEMYEWITSNCIIQFNIPKEFVDKWNTTFLYYPDAIKWYQWFRDRNEKYNNVEYIDDCANKEDCYDCTEFIKLGGTTILNALGDWLNNIDLDTSYSTNSASISIPICFTNSIDDLGEMSIFSNKYDKDVDYHNTLVNSGGTVVYDYSYDDSMMIKNSAATGHEYDTNYLENKLKTDDWSGYTEYYIKNNNELFVPQFISGSNIISVSSYTYSPINGKIIYNPAISGAVRESYAATSGKCVCINGVINEVIDGKYVQFCYNDSSIANLKYKSNEKLQIFKDGSLEYAIVNGKRKYVETNSRGEEKIYFVKESNCNDPGCPVTSGKSYIVLDGCVYLLSDNKKTVTIEDGDTKSIYPVLDGYFEVDGSTLYISGSNVVVQNGCEYNEETSAYTYTFRKINEENLSLFNLDGIKYSVSTNNVTLYYKYDIIGCKKITGMTGSKLELLRRKEITTDDLGNELPGYFRSVIDISDSGGSQSRYNVPYDECTLDILYKVGEVSNLIPISGNSTYDYFYGNIITNIEFFYQNENGEHKLSRTANDDDAITTIKKLEEDYKASEDSSIINQMMCEITYYIGADIRFKKVVESDEKRTYSLRPISSYNSGVKYIDKVYVTKDVGTYYLNYDKSFTFSYYRLSQDYKRLEVSDLNASLLWNNSTYFEMELYLYKKDGTVNLRFNKSHFEKNNLMCTLPVFRTEYDLAAAFPQNVDADIYIDRGINAAFEKHLKLQEIRTMEALENYSNEGLKINKY